jgi:alkanesulfonate monooxygenase SsuD/methylene tetrahydromethanopterin reductase-like flavin-dependent oxidoreductase (luciferase family)
VTSKPISIGYKLPNCGGVLCEPEWARPKTILDLAALANSLDFDSVWLHDHTVTPQELQHLHEPHFYESVTLMGILGASVPRIRIGIGTLILPLRDPVILTKQLVTLGEFFPDRIIAGIGLGRFESEFLAFGSDDYHSRGKVANEYLDVMQALLREPSATVSGQFRSVTGARVYPKPSSGSPSIWIGGDSPAAARRARRYGSAWIVSRNVSLADITAQRQPQEDSLDETAVDVVVTAAVENPQLSGKGNDESHNIHASSTRLRGDPSLVATKLREYIDAGVTQFMLSFAAVDVDAVKAQMRWFASEVRPLLEPARTT